MTDTITISDPFVTKRKASCADCGAHIPVGAQDYPDREDDAPWVVRLRFEQVVWCEPCRQWVAMDRGVTRRGLYDPYGLFTKPDSQKSPVLKRRRSW